MATERRPYHRTADSIGDELWTNDELAFVTRLSALLHSRWRSQRLTGDEACRVTLGMADLLKVSGMRDTRAARTLGARVAVRISCVIDASDARLTHVFWPKWAEFQGLESQTGERLGRKRSPSESESASSVPKKREEIAPNGAPPRRLRKAPIAKSDPPERLSDQQRADVLRFVREKEPWAAERVVELEALCLDHHRENDTQKSNWPLTVKNWIRRERVVFGRHRGPPVPRGQSIPLAPRSRVSTEDMFASREVPIR